LIKASEHGYFKLKFSTEKAFIKCFRFRIHCKPRTIFYASSGQIKPEAFDRTTIVALGFWKGAAREPRYFISQNAHTWANCKRQLPWSTLMGDFVATDVGRIFPIYAPYHWLWNSHKFNWKMAI